MLSSDLHIHTVMCGHAFCTVDECIKAARYKRMSLIAIIDHGPSSIPHMKAILKCLQGSLKDLEASVCFLATRLITSIAMVM
jgi:histidinol phosphatase-like PHP family hydrolase